MNTKKWISIVITAIGITAYIVLPCQSKGYFYSRALLFISWFLPVILLVIYLLSIWISKRKLSGQVQKTVLFSSFFLMSISILFLTYLILSKAAMLWKLQYISFGDDTGTYNRVFTPGFGHAGIVIFAFYWLISMLCMKQRKNTTYYAASSFVVLLIVLTFIASKFGYLPEFTDGLR